ncbi:RNA-binding cell elongation regulator Jag/EloR [Bittarella massiliensis (ex Durand et al. 2017)]|uniref:RNA-binding protein KhpB n=1 Tax=Bittarella massiliensis (ex Durand et al. 2017) TaxID=1720313 RepID=A0AAW5K6Z5_9FIRM|nr:RNA-binding cell elongation regulator Jag/EloR [Bittarella massiliensis (ex Durand et al. 2017)]MCQ4948711.1 protein jag [Bittarella massiliensis (ex Durand et al. 2017)]
MRECIKTAPDVDRAIALACEELGVSPEEANVEVLELPSKRLFGLLGTTPAKVRVQVEEPEWEKKQAAEAARPAPVAPPAKREPQPVKQADKPAPAPEKKAEEEPVAPKAREVSEAEEAKAAVAESYLRDILQKMGMEGITVERRFGKDGVIFNLSGSKVGGLIGRRGETLDAIQYLTSLCCNRGGGDYLKVSIDSGDYREKRKETLEALAKKIAGQVVKSGRSTALEPMNPYERRIIHSAVQTVEGATSKSVGEDPYRKVVISSKNPVKRSRPPYDRSRRSGGRRDGGENRSRERSQSPRPPQKPAEKPKDEAAELPLYGKIEL